jgi:Na+-driven multidrug efflux pump
VQGFSELSPREKRIEVARWLLLLPAALLASSIVTFIIGTLVHSIGNNSVPPNSASISFWVIAVPLYVLPEFVFVIAGAWIAPRQRLPVALLLMLLGGVLSLLKHVVLQHLGGTSLGPTNYTHFGLELAGLLAGVVCIGKVKVVPHGSEWQ